MVVAPVKSDGSFQPFSEFGLFGDSLIYPGTQNDALSTMVFVASGQHYNDLVDLTSNACRYCHEKFSTVQELNQHLSILHQTFLCLICIESLSPLFLSEHELFTSQALRVHLRNHPECKFCYKKDKFERNSMKGRFFDNEQLRVHFNANHWSSVHVDFGSFSSLPSLPSLASSLSFENVDIQSEKDFPALSSASRCTSVQQLLPTNGRSGKRQQHSETRGGKSKILSAIQGLISYETSIPPKTETDPKRSRALLFSKLMKIDEAADAVDIETESFAMNDDIFCKLSLPVYSSGIIQWALENTNTLLKIESRFSQLIQNNGERTSATAELKPMPHSDRKAVHVLAKYYRLSTRSYGENRHRYVSVSRSKQSCIPKVLLSKALGLSISRIGPVGKVFIRFSDISEDVIVAASLVFYIRNIGLSHLVIGIFSTCLDDLTVHFETEEHCFLVYEKLLPLMEKVAKLTASFDVFLLAITCSLVPSSHLNALRCGRNLNDCERCHIRTPFLSWWKHSKVWVDDGVKQSIGVGSEGVGEIKARSDISPCQKPLMKKMSCSSETRSKESEFCWGKLRANASGSSNRFSELSYDDDSDENEGISVKASNEEVDSDKEKLELKSWCCPLCTFNNLQCVICCEMCGTSRQDTLSLQRNIICSSCTFVNVITNGRFCEICEGSLF